LIARLESLPETEEVHKLRADASRMERLVTQMLQMARIDGVPLDTTRLVDLRAVATEAISVLAPLALRRGVDLELIGEQARSISGNHAVLVVAVQNLIENAIAHAPAGSTVQVELLPPATLRVLDRGPGIPVEEREVVFQRFRRGRRRTHADGAGLGLAIVAEIVAAHGGSVHVAGREGGGAAIVMDLHNVREITPFATGDHGQHEILAMQPARNDHPDDVHADQGPQEMG
jgi:signal transduction histidine kinase